MKRTLMAGIIAAALAVAVSPVCAADISFITGIAQNEFKSLSKEAGAALAYRNLAPAAPLGITGFDIGAEASAMSIDKSSPYWKAAFGNDTPPSYLVVPKVRARKGLPFGIDVGAMYSYIPDTNIKLYGVEVSKSLLDGGVALPALSIRGTYTRLAGVDDLALNTFGADASISKGFLFITPYAGAGIVQINSEAQGKLKSTYAPTLKSESISVPRYFGGVKITPFPLFSITAEAEHAVRPIYSLKVALGF